MKTIMQKALIALLMLGSYALHAQDSFEEFTSQSIEDLEKKVRVDCPRENGKNGGGYKAHMPTLGQFPKKVALISFFTIDPGNYKKTPTDPSMYSYTKQATPASLTAFSNSFYKMGVDALIESFKERGMDLLLPEQYLDTEEKKEYYNTFPLTAKEASKKKIKLNPLAILENKMAKAMPADGFRAMNIGTVPFFTKGKPPHGEYMFSFKNLKTLTIYGHDLCEKLGVDAVLIVHNLTTVPTKAQDKFVLNYVGMHLIGPNPVQKDGGLIYGKGVFYEGMRMKTGGKGLLISNFIANTKDVVGYDKLIQAISNKMFGKMQEAMDK